ncbi:hypothetical protein [uncultured Methanobrevibacter sp.]|uniref:hypothetical protein n=1 Tax=uncultured Methanobrevibacter sp. TaxID=253161 RepID=UPI0025FA173C|nr:hypothetical protein [uncultured Methanobrevibacter sp.]
MDCKRLPGNYLNIKNYNLPKTHISDNLPEQLSIFRKENKILNDGLIELCYTDSDVIVIISKNTVAWTETLHNKLCEKFNVILTSVEKNELFEPRNYKLNIIWIYIPKFYNDKHNDDFSVKFKNVNF